MEGIQQRASGTPHRRVAKILLATSASLFIIASALGAYIMFAPSNTYTATILQPTSTGSTEQATVSALARQYMTDLLQHQYEKMWSLLHSDIQAMWPDQASFVNYWQNRFQAYQLKSFSVGKVSQMTYWINPESMIRYNNVDVLPISLHLENQLPAAQQAQLAPQFQHPDQLFQNLPFIVQKTSGNQWRVLSGGPADLEAPILPPVTPAYRTATVPILMYHHISDAPTTNVLDQSLTVTPTLFSSQLDFLKQQGYHSITLNQLMDALYYGGPLPKKPIILTFDDGYEDAYQFAYPLLKAHGFSGMFYIITGKVGWQGQATWDQLRTMLANGMQMGSHTVHHVDMGDTYQASPALAQQEAQISQSDLQSHLGIPIQHFCYPNGGPFKGNDTALQDAVVNLLAQQGYVSATTDPGPTGITQSSLSTLALLRLRIDGRYSLQQFMAIMSS
jgi:peptidoglycan/xylan/chitin deacetylase (PgdA/CDA1 family)